MSRALFFAAYTSFRDLNCGLGRGGSGLGGGACVDIGILRHANVPLGETGAFGTAVYAERH